MKAGDTVTWESQAQGSFTQKTGKVVALIPIRASAKNFLPKDVKKSHVKFDTDRSLDRERVLVAVPAGKDGQITHYYCPSKGILKAQGNE